MPLLRVNASASGISMHDTFHPVVRCVASALRRSTGPVIVMVHGYKYAPTHRSWCPHNRIFACAGPHGWPLGLGLGSGDTLGVAFGWPARGRLAAAAKEAQVRGRELAALVTLLRRTCPHRPVQVIAHSLGATLVFSALAHLRPGDVGRIVLLAGAAHRQQAASALRTPAGAAAELINLTSRENDIFDFAFEWLVPGGASLGQGINAPNVRTVQIDCPHTLSALADLGHDIAPSTRRVCHRSSYTRKGIMAFNARLLRDPSALSLRRLKTALPDRTAPRWSRLRLSLPRSLLSFGVLTAPRKGPLSRRRADKETDPTHAY